MPELQAARRENLRKLIQVWNGSVYLATVLGYKTSSFLVQMTGPNPSRPVTEKSARAIEAKLDLPYAILDRPQLEESELYEHRRRVDPKMRSRVVSQVREPWLQPLSGNPPPRTAHAVAEPQTAAYSRHPTGAEDRPEAGTSLAPASIVAEAMRVLGAAAADAGVAVPPEKFGELAALIYEDAAEHGRLRPTYVTRLLNLLK